jgi:hypothetical protein
MLNTVLIKLITLQRLLSFQTYVIKMTGYLGGELVLFNTYFLIFYKSYRLLSPYRLYNLFRDLFIFFKIFKSLDLGFYFLYTEINFKLIALKFVYFSFLQNSFLGWYKSIFTNLVYVVDDCVSLNLLQQPYVVFCLNVQKNLEILRELRYKFSPIVVGMGEIKKKGPHNLVDYFFPLSVLSIYSLY